MATIRRFPFVSHATGTATRVLVQGAEGRLRVRGAGAAFWFRPLGTTLSEVPVEDLEFGGVATVTTADRQEVSIQTALTARIFDPNNAVRRLDFAIDVRTGEWRGQPLRTLQNLMAELVAQSAALVVARLSLQEVLSDGLRLVGEALTQALGQAGQLVEAGIGVVGVRVIAIRPDEDLERALQTTIRESIQAEADRATYERRAQAVDRERAIKENELNNRTELARREAELVELQGANERRRSEQEVERASLEVDAKVERIARVAQAENGALSTRLAAFDGRDLPAVLAAIAPEIVAALPKVDAVTITPDQLTNALATVFSGVRA